MPRQDGLESKHMDNLLRWKNTTRSYLCREHTGISLTWHKLSEIISTYLKTCMGRPLSARAEINRLSAASARF